jgi:hypothetical protein
VTIGGIDRNWDLATEIVRFPDDPQLQPDARLPASKFVPDKDATLGTYDEQGFVEGIPFEAYDNGDGTIDWFGRKQLVAGQPLRHTCITPRLNGPNPVGHKQLWVLHNKTGTLHNFHIHQMKFRLAKKSELIQYRIEPPEPASTCGSQPCTNPNYRYYDDETDTKKFEVVWHDTIPVPAGKRVFLIMSFDAKEQLGRFVYHCHILKHEDSGLMAPIEVLDASTLDQ